MKAHLRFMTCTNWVMTLAVSMVLTLYPEVFAQNFANDGPAVKNKMQYPNPIPMGTSGFNTAAGDCATGTLGSLVNDTRGRTYILSNNHVLALTNQGNKGADPIKHVGPIDTPSPICSGVGSRQVATLTDFQPIDFNNPNTVDAAIAEIFPDNAVSNIVGIPSFSSVVEPPTMGAVVIKSGRTSGLTKGTILAIHMPVNNVEYEVNGVKKTANFTNQIAITPVIPNAFFSDAGDSGSLILQCDTKDKQWHPVGLLFAGGLIEQVNNDWVYSIETTYANRLDEVKTAFSRLGYDLSFSGVPPNAKKPDCTTVAGVTKAQEIQGAYLATPQGAAALESANEVENRYGKFLSAQEAVLSVGLGFSDKGTTQIVIKVFVRGDVSPEAVGGLPKMLDGIELELVPVLAKRIIAL